MSRTEDYLDELLHSVSPKEKEGQDARGTGKRFRTPEDDFLSAFEEEILSGEDTDDFLQQFEQELDLGGKGFDDSAAASANMESLQSGSMELHPVEADAGVTDDTKQERMDEETSGEDDLKTDVMMDDLDSILNNAKERMGVESSEGDIGTASEDFGDGMELMVDTLGDVSEEGFTEEPYTKSSDLEKRLENIADATEGLKGISDLDEDFGLDEFDTESFGISGEEPELSLDADPVGEEASEVLEGKKKRRMKRVKKEKGKKKEKVEENGEKLSFLQKFSRIVFGEDEEITAENAGAAESTGAAGEVSEGDMGIFSEMESGGAEAAPTKEETDKKKSKKEKKKKEKKPKQKKPKKEKKPKQKKPKKVKPPKEKDNTPPLPKMPVILICIMTASLLALILVGTNLVGYTNQFANADAAYKMGDYTEAYRSVRGIEVKEKDTELYEKYRIMASAQSKFDAYQSFMEAGIYDMALDSLVHTIGRCDKYAADAEVYGCYSELIELKDYAVGALSTFGINEERAAELYGIENKKDYSTEIHNVLVSAGLVTED